MRGSTLAEWLVEQGIGETRAALIDGGEILQTRVERDGDGHLPGARVLARLIDAHARLARSNDGQELLLTHRPDLSEGRDFTAEIRRAAIAEAALVKRATAVAVDGPPTPLPPLAERLARGGLPVCMLAAHAPDTLEAAGWSELWAEAAGGLIPFPGGLLRLSLTPAMVVFDIDGNAPPGDLARGGAAAAAATILRMGLGGGIVIDCPRVADKAARAAIDAAFDEAWQAGHGGHYERTATSGFGLLHIIVPRTMPSIAERAIFDRVGSAAIALLRRAERARGTGALTLHAHPAVVDWLAARDALTGELAARTGRPVSLSSAHELAMEAGHAQ